MGETPQFTNQGLLIQGHWESFESLGIFRHQRNGSYYWGHEQQNRGFYIKTNQKWASTCKWG